MSLGFENLSNEVFTDASLMSEPTARISGVSMLDRTKQLLDKLLLTKSAVQATGPPAALLEETASSNSFADSPARKGQLLYCL